MCEQIQKSILIQEIKQFKLKGERHDQTNSNIYPGTFFFNLK
jgi:hypothetical protein